MKPIARRSVPLSLRIFLVYAAFVVAAGWLVLRKTLEEVKPAVRQSTEETLVDTAHLLAEIIAPDAARGALSQTTWPEVLRKYGERRPSADIWGVHKGDINHRVYVVDSQGTVLLDSSGADVGKDYSQWRDVYLTLRGKYGARSTRASANDEASTVMYVAAPLYDGARIIGAVTVAKPNHSVQPFILAARHRLVELGVALVAFGLVLGAGLSIWLGRSVRKLTHYARTVSAGERARVPRLPGGELSQLAAALDSMRSELDGHAYVERYVQTLTHEFKSPLAAIRAAAELLDGPMPEERRARFVHNIEAEAQRLQAMCERLLALAQLEKRQTLEERRTIDIPALCTDVVARFESRAQSRQVTITIDSRGDGVVDGEPFLIEQAVSNLLENALEFTHSGGTVRVGTDVRGTWLTIRVYNEGEPIPEYALGRLCERFYSLPRPGTGRKSTGLGLSFVLEVAQLHGGKLAVVNAEGGVLATMQLPVASRANRLH